MLAPIGISVYSRLKHLKQTINALKSNTIAKASKLYIFSDGPRAGDETAVREMRNYLTSIDGFDEVVVIDREINSRVENNRGWAKISVEKIR